MVNKVAATKTKITKIIEIVVTTTAVKTT